VPVANMDWKTFVSKVKSEYNHKIEDRFELLNYTNDLFKKYESFKDFTEDERKIVAGLPNHGSIESWGFFGTMSGAGMFANRIKENDINISDALDEIPLTSQITKRHYVNFIEKFKNISNKMYVAPASRLLTMKRPDVFVCLNSANKSALSKDFKITVSNFDYEKYWNDIILRIYDCQWWQNSFPKGKEEKQINEFRSALLDSIYYKY